MADGKGDGAADAAMGWGILAVIFAGLAYMVWWAFSTQIMNGIRWIRYGEMLLISPFVDKDTTITWDNQIINYHDFMEIARTLPADQIDGTFLALASVTALTFYKWVFIACMFVAGFWALRKGPGTEHRSVFDLDRLIGKQANIFPIISPFIRFNPSTMPPRAPGPTAASAWRCAGCAPMAA